MTNKLLIERELLELSLNGDEQQQAKARNKLREQLAAPRQPEGEGLEVVGLQWLDSGHYRKKPPKYGFNPHDWNELCRLSDAQRAIAELRDSLDVMTRCADNYSRMFEESAEECEQWKSGANAEAARADELKAERDTLRQQLAEEREHCTFATEKLFAAEAQRDKLAGLLDEVTDDFVVNYLDADLIKRIDAALAEVNK